MSIKQVLHCGGPSVSLHRIIWILILYLCRDHFCTSINEQILWLVSLHRWNCFLKWSPVIFSVKQKFWFDYVLGLSAPTGLCNPGFYCPGNNTVGNPTATPCPIGLHCPEGSGVPVPCEPGTFTNLTQMSECLICPASFYCVPEEVIQGIRIFFKQFIDHILRYILNPFNTVLEFHLIVCILKIFIHRVGYGKLFL